MFIMSSYLNSVNTDLTSLLWDDILFPYVFPHLTLKDIFLLRGTSKASKKLVDCYFSRMKKCDLTCYHGSFTPVAFSTFETYWICFETNVQSKLKMSLVKGVRYFDDCALDVHKPIDEYQDLTGFKDVSYVVLIGHCKQLRVFFTRFCCWLTNDMLKQIFMNNKSLTHIDLSFCCNISSVALQPVILYQKQLVYLKLENCYWLTSGCLEALALHHCKLEVLSLDNCSVADVQAISILLQRSKNLRELSLSGVFCVSDSIMEVVAHCNRKLKLLNVNGCQQITDYGVRMVGEYCRELEYLFLSGCPIAFQTIKQLEKKIRFLFYENRVLFNQQDPYSYVVHIPV